MLVNCPICSEILLPSDHLSTTPCGHIFHQGCVNRWLSSNSTCPQCRQECSQQNTHRIYLPEVNFQDDDQLIERLNEFNRLKMEAESKAKKIDTEKKNLERELKKRKKEFHKVIQRSKSLRKNGPSTSSHIPSQRYKSTTVNVFVGGSQVQSGASKDQNTASARAKRKRNQSRTERTKAYFQRKRAERLGPRNATEPGGIEIVADSPVVISVSDDSSSN